MLKILQASSKYFRVTSKVLKKVKNSEKIRAISSIKSYQLSRMPRFEYPVARKDESVCDTFHSVKIKDPYRWLEDPDSEETQKFVESQNAVAEPFLKTGPEWDKLNKKLTKFWNYPKYSCPSRHGDRYFFNKNTGLQNQSVLYIQKSIDDEPTVFLDPNTLSDDGTIALIGSHFSEDGSLYAYALSESGSDWSKIKIKEVETGKDFPETLIHTKNISIAWTIDNKGFFYPRYPAQSKADGSENLVSENQKLYYHRIGEDQEKDVLVAEFPEDPSWRLSPEVSHCGKYLLLSIMKGCKDSLLYFAKIEGLDVQGKLEFTKVVEKFEADYDYITNEGTIFSFRTNKNACNYHVINIDFASPDATNWKVLIPEHTKNVLDWCHCVDKNRIILCYIDDVKNVLLANSLNDGKELYKFELPIGTIVGFSGEKKYSEIFYHFVSFLTPGIIYQYDFAKADEKPRILREITLDGFDGSQFKVEQVFYNSKDGERIPMFIVEKKSTGRKPKGCLLYGYGGFNICIQPVFSVTGLVFIDSFDGVLAYPNIRGGGEYGERWHNAGRLLNKQNCFDDFHAAAEYLVKEGYSTNDKIVIQGGSNGGLLVAACINQRPDLFGAAIVQVGVLDMLRYHKFTVGKAWTSDYGEIEDPAQFQNLIKYSPLHNVKRPKNEQEQYPATLVLTGSHDDRVSPLHSLKFMAALHEVVKDCECQTNPLFLRVYSKAGHGMGKPTTKKIEEATDILTFMCKTMKLNLNA